ncbi:MAG: tyrosine-protein phosphatase [Clostridiales bacterium]|nr:tyrosine-protein phosphatase [Clostridiales bacterium]
MSLFRRKRPRRIANFRDLGGIVGFSGRRIRPGMLYRSGHIARLTERDAQLLIDRYGIKAVVDLRSDSEQTEKPDVIIKGIEYYVCSSLSDKENPAVNKENRRRLLQQIMEFEGGARSFLKESYRKMVTTPRALDAYSRLLRLLVNNDDGGAILWHCTQGKDRAGVGTAAVLLALGVSREDIMKDYMRSNKYYRYKNKLIFALVFVLAHSIRAAVTLHHLLSARREYLNSAFDALDEKFGGTEGFLRDGLKLTDEDIALLRERYLEPEPAIEQC